METGIRPAATRAHRRRMSRVRAIVRRQEGGLGDPRRRRRTGALPHPPPPPHGSRNIRQSFVWQPPPPDPVASAATQEAPDEAPPGAPPAQSQSPRRSSGGCGGFFSRLLHRSRRTRVAPAHSSAPRESEEAWRGICVICWEPYDKGIRRFRCRHKDFCRGCIAKWKEKGDTCPLCRACPRGVRLFKG